MPNRVGRRTGRARPARPRGRAARRHDRDLRRRLRADRRAATAAARRRRRRAAVAAPAPGRRRAAARRRSARPPASRASRDALGTRDRRARGRAGRARRARRRPRRARTRAYRAELDRLGLWDRDLRARPRRRAARRTSSPPGTARPVYAYGFEDLTGAAVGAARGARRPRATSTVSLPYEPGRAAFASLERTADDLARLAAGRIEELPPRYARVRAPGARAPRARAVRRTPPPAPPDRGRRPLPRGRRHARRRSSSSPTRSSSCSAAGTRPRRSLVVCPSVERVAGAARDGVRRARRAVRARRDGCGSAQTPFGQALLVAAPLRVARRRPARALRLPALAVLRPRRGRTSTSSRAGSAAARIAHARARRGGDVKLRGAAARRRSSALREARRRRSPPSAELAASMLARGLRARALRPRRGGAARPAGLPGRARLLDELEAWARARRSARREELLAALERRRSGSARAASRVASPCSTCCARARAAPRSCSCSGSRRAVLPRRGAELAVPRRRSAPRARRARPARAARPGLPRPLPLLHGVHAPVAAALSRPRGGDRRRLPARAEPVLGRRPRRLRSRRRRALDAPAPALRARRGRSRTRRASASGSAPSRWLSTDRRLGAPRRSRRERLGAPARPRARRLPPHDAARRTRACSSSSRARTTFGVTELEAFADCSSIWLVERLVDPKTIDAEVDARMRGSIAHQALFKLLLRPAEAARLRAGRAGAARRGARVPRANASTTRSPAAPRTGSSSPTSSATSSRQSLWRDLEALVRAEAESTLPLVPRRFEVSFGVGAVGARAAAGPRPRRHSSSRGRSTASTSTRSRRAASSGTTSRARRRTRRRRSSASCSSRSRCTCSSCATSSASSLSAGSTGRSPATGRRAGCCAPRRRRDGVPGCSRNDYVDEEEFWGKVERAQESAAGSSPASATGDVQPRPDAAGRARRWCELGSMCRVGKGSERG